MSLLISTVPSGSRNRLCAAGRRAVHDAGNRAAVLGAHHQHVAAVAVGDDLLLQVLRRVALAQERFERGAQLRLLPPQPFADAGERRAGVVGHLARRLDLPAHGGDLGSERGDGLDEALEHRIRLGRRGDDAARRLDRFQIVGQTQEVQRLERAPLDLQPAENGFELRRRPQRKARRHRQEAHALGGGGLRRAHARRFGERGQRPRAARARSA